MDHVIVPKSIDRLRLAQDMPANNKKEIKYKQYAKYEKYEKYVPVLPFWSEKVESLYAIVKVRLGPVNATHMHNCAVEHKIIVFTRQSPVNYSFSYVSPGLGHWRGADELVILSWPTINMRNMSDMLNMQNM